MKLIGLIRQSVQPQVLELPELFPELFVWGGADAELLVWGGAGAELASEPESSESVEQSEEVESLVVVVEERVEGREEVFVRDVISECWISFL